MEIIKFGLIFFRKWQLTVIKRLWKPFLCINNVITCHPKLRQIRNSSWPRSKIFYRVHLSTLVRGRTRRSFLRFSVAFDCLYLFVRRPFAGNEVVVDFCTFTRDLIHGRLHSRRTTNPAFWEIVVFSWSFIFFGRFCKNKIV